VLPFRFSHYGERLAGFVDAASSWAFGDEGEALVPVDLAPARAAVARVRDRADALERRIDDNVAAARLPASSTLRLNDILARLEQRLLDDREPADTRWYRHVIYGWNIYSLYDGQPFPGLAEAIRLRDAGRAQQEVARIVAALDRLADGLAEATATANEK
jgi:Transferrin receptor-like dimerisation domain